MNATARHLGTLAVAVLALLGCPGPTSSPTPPSGTVVLDVLRRDATGALVGVPGIPVHRNDATTGAFLETRTTDATGRVDFGALAGPVTLSIVRPAPSGGGITRAYTLLGVPAGSARLRLDRLPGEPGASLATVDVALAPALSAIERASAWLPGGQQGNAPPAATGIPGVVINEQDVQSDGRVSLLTQVDDDEMGTAVGCRLSLDQAVASGTTSLPPAASVLPASLAIQGPLSLDRVVAVRKGVAFPLRPSPTCAAAFSDADGFSVQGSLGLGAPDEQVPSFYLERRASQKRGALWLPGPGLSTANALTIPSADAAIAALSYGSGTVHFTLQGGEVRPLVAARATILWGANAWTLYAGLSVGPSTCDGTAADAACTLELKLPDLAAVGIPPDQMDGLQVGVEAVAPEGMSTAGGFWTQLRAQGDAEAVLARGYRSAYRSLSLSQIHYTVDVAPYVLPGWFPLGRVVGSGGIDCSQLRQGSCTATFSGGSSVTLTAIPNSGAEFVDWQICDTGNTNPTLTFTLNRDSTCFPRFRSLPASYPLDVGVVSTGNGLIASDDGWISCGYDTNHVPHSSCNFNYSSGSLVVLRAYPSDSLNAYDLAWGGDCAGTAGETSFVMDGPKTCTVELTPRP